MEPVEIFLADIKDRVQYDVIKVALTTDLTTNEIADKFGILPKTCGTRIQDGARHLAITNGRLGLKTAYIDFLEYWIKES